MTITINDTRNEYTATASQTVFNYTFKIFESTDLNVYQTPAGQTPADTDLITAYTVVGEGLSAGGSITLNVAATIGDLITIVSDVPESRTTDYQFNGDFIPDTVNDDFDRVVSLAKQSQSIIGRTPQFPEATQNATGLSWEAPEVGGFIRWKSDLSGLENIQLNTAVGADNAAAISFDNSSSGLVSTDVQGALDEFQAGVVTYGKIGSPNPFFKFARGADGEDKFGIMLTDLEVDLGNIARTGVDDGNVVGGIKFTDNFSTNLGTAAIDLRLPGSTSGESILMQVFVGGGYHGSIRGMTSTATGGDTIVLQWNATEIKALVPITNPTFTVGTLPSAAIAGQTIYVSDEAGGAVMAFSDGTNWRRSTDRAVVS